MLRSLLMCAAVALYVAGLIGSGLAIRGWLLPRGADVMTATLPWQEG